MPKINAAAPTSPAPYGGYSLTRVRRAGGDETQRFEAVLVHDSRQIAFVSNGGEGGGHRWSPVAPDGWSDIDAFDAFAVAWNAGSEFAGLEDGDQLINRLLMVDRLNRARLLPFVLDDEDFWLSGEHDAFQGATAAQALEVLRSTTYAARNPRVWSRVAGDFVPVV